MGLLPAKPQPPAFAITDVVAGGFCVGCGACAVADGGIVMRDTATGTVVADLGGASPEALDRASRICPFSDLTPNETDVATRLFAGEGAEHDSRTGFHTSVLAGSITDQEARTRSSSGGITHWLLQRLLSSGMADGIIHVGAADGEPAGALFAYTISLSAEAAARNRKSHYYATEVATVLRSIRGDGRRYVFVGVPCFVTAARHLAASDPVLSGQLAVFVGLICGHLKSRRFAELMAWQLDVPPDDLAAVDFRVKDAGLPSNRHRFAAQSRASGQWSSAVAAYLYGGNWGHAFFQLRACDFCDDLFAEAADIAVGDAWLPRFEEDSRGTSIVVSRRRALDALLAEGRADGSLALEPLSLDDAAQSQIGTLRHRREGLSLRLKDAIRAGERVPAKRVAPGSVRLPWYRRAILRLRRRSAALSHVAFAEARRAGDLAVFMAALRPITERMALYDRLGRVSTVRGFAGAVLRRLRLRR